MMRSNELYGGQTIRKRHATSSFVPQTLLEDQITSLRSWSISRHLKVALN